MGSRSLEYCSPWNQPFFPNLQFSDLWPNPRRFPWSYPIPSLVHLPLPHVSHPRTTLLLPPILPTRTIHTPLRLLTNPLPAILALDSMLNDLIIRYPGIQLRNNIQRDANTKEVEYFIQEGAITHWSVTKTPTAYHLA